jgi:quaternary ammonium compound-resistance protein SugE
MKHPPWETAAGVLFLNALKNRHSAPPQGPAWGRPHQLLVKRRGTARQKPEAYMAWFVLFCAGLLEIGWAVGLKYSEGFTRLAPSVLTILAMMASLTLLGFALKTLPLGTAYAIWTGIGTVGTAILGITLLGEPAEAMRLGCIALIVAGIVGLKLMSPH